MQIRRGTSRVHRGFEVITIIMAVITTSPCDERTTASESPRVGAGVFPSPSMCLCTHRETLQVGVHRCLPCVYTESLKHSRVCFGRGAARRGSADRHVPYEPEKRSSLTSRGATPLSGESTLGKYQCAMRKFFGFQPHSGSVFSAARQTSSFLPYPFWLQMRGFDKACLLSEKFTRTK